MTMGTGNIKWLRRALALLISAGLTSPSGPAFAQGDACASGMKKWQRDCGAGLAATGAAGSTASGPTDGANQQGTQLASAAGQYGATATQAGSTCSKAAGECRKACKGEKAKQCDGLANGANMANSAADQANSMQQQSANTAGAAGGGGLGDIMPLVGALAGAGLAYMMAKKQEEEQKKKQMEQQLAQQLAMMRALQPNGTLDCSKPDAFQYADCNGYLANLCTQKMAANVFQSDGPCRTFASRYCGGGGLASSRTGVAGSPPAYIPIGSLPPPTLAAPSANDMAGLPAMAQVGDGLASDPGFCQSVLAYNYCTQPGRNQCPSCVQLAQSRTQGCQANPASCLAQNSPEQVNLARQNCPTDPMFANPALAAVGLGATGGGLNPGAPAVVLPQNKKRGLSTASAVHGSGSGSGVGVAGGSSVSGGDSHAKVLAASSAGSASRDGRPSRGIGAPSQTSSSSSFAPASAGSSTDRVAGGGSSGRDVASSVTDGPAPDVQGQFGPSVFAVGSQAIRQWCQAGKVSLHCR